MNAKHTHIDDIAILILVLHRYWIWANKMRLEFYESMLKVNSSMSAIDIYVNQCGMYMSYWYASLYAVIEGYVDFKLSSPAVDEMLKDQEMVDHLRRFRNGAFHVQADYFSDKFTNLINENNSVEWISKLTDGMGSYLLSEMKKLNI